eukprot:8771501-Lingulodinium_polyedra.AAC.1
MRVYNTSAHAQAAARTGKGRDVNRVHGMACHGTPRTGTARNGTARQSGTWAWAWAWARARASVGMGISRHGHQ